jgi:hypothetical protein
LYIWHKFVLYDNVEWMGQGDMGWQDIERALWEDRNAAFVPVEQARAGEDYPWGQPGEQSRQRAGGRSRTIPGPSEELAVTKFSANEIKLRTNFASPRFLVYNDAYHSGWQALMDGFPVKIWRANVAFKGLWVPQGEHQIHLYFGRPWQYHLEGALGAVFGCLFVYLAVLFWRGQADSLKKL